MNHDAVLPQIVIIRGRFALFTEFYDAPKNKKFIYSLSLAAWTILFMLSMTILPLTATSTYRVAFYLPLLVFTFLNALSTHWLIQCALEDYRINGYRIGVNTVDEADTFVIQT